MAVSEIAIGKDQHVFAKIESVFNTFNKPGANDMVPIIDDVSFQQSRVFREDMQKRMTLSKLSRKTCAYDPGELSLSMYVKPIAGITVPRGDAVLQALFGNSSITGGTQVAYLLGGINDTVPGLSFIVRDGKITKFISGAVINTGSLPQNAGNGPEAIGQMSVTGQYCKELRAGEGTCPAGAAQSATTFDVNTDEGVRFDVGSYIEFQLATGLWDSNAGAGYLISDVTTDTITTTALVVAIPAGAVIRGWIPTAVDAGVQVCGRLGTAEDSDDAGSTWETIQLMDTVIEINNNFKILNEEKTGTAWPTSAIKANDREVTITYGSYFRAGATEYWYNADTQVQRWVRIPLGNASGVQYHFDMELVEFDTPTLEGGEERQVSRVGHCFGSSGFDDEIRMIFD